MMSPAYALESSDVDKIIAGIRETYKGHPMITAHKIPHTTGLTAFVMTVEDMASLTFLPDGEGKYQLEKVEGEDASIICITFNLWVKKHTGKDWPAEIAS